VLNEVQHMDIREGTGQDATLNARHPAWRDRWQMAIRSGVA
jgi:hypothetical protein